ncbi:MAG: hypothetical protein KOO63_14160 [Bacteroidales bacterium]|nr:hypothetical protein [Candidatus Latescibacterota bacterium]
MITLTKSLCIGLLLAAVPFLVHAEDNEPVFPDSSWVRLDLSSVNTHPGFDSLGDVFSGGGAEWEQSPLVKAYSEFVEPQTLVEIVQEIIRIKKVLAHSPNFEEGNGPRIRASLTRELDSLIASFADQLAETPQRLATWESVREKIGLNNFQIIGSRWRGSSVEGATESIVSSTTILFAGKPTQIVLSTTQGDLSFMPFVYFATLPQAIEVRVVCNRILHLFNAAYVEQLDVTVKRLGQINKAWDTYLSKGFSQYPWEFLLNSHIVDFSWSRPPVWQLVVVHPEAATVIDIRNSSTTQTESSIAIHGLGFVRYLGDERNWFLGSSFTVSIPQDDELGLGTGLTVHFGHADLYSQFPHLSLSILWHDFASNSHGPVIGVSIDFWKLFSRRGGEELFRKVLDERK